MSEQLIEEKLREALTLHDAGKSYAEIRLHFKDMLDDHAISYIIRLVDEFAIEEKRMEEDIKKAKFKMFIGMAAFFFRPFCFIFCI